MNAHQPTFPSAQAHDAAQAASVSAPTPTPTPDSSASAHPAQTPVVGGIWARTPQGIIGKDGTIPWHVPEDLKFFASVTTGHPVIMGRRTWESFPDAFRPLPRRPNIVITSRPESIPADGTHVWTASSYSEALKLAQSLLGPQESNPQIWAIGGTGVWREAMDHPTLPLSLAYVTTVDLQVDGDTRAPDLSEAWNVKPVRDWESSVKGPQFRIDRYTRDVA